MKNCARRRTLPGIIIALLCLLPALLPAQTPRPPSVFREGEDLIYNVRYGPFDLGQIRIRTYGRINGPNGVAVVTRADINSYPKVPFVDLHAVFESRIDTAVFSHWFYGKLKEDDRWDFSRYTFDYARGKLKMEIGRFDTVVSSRETLSVSGPMQDGLSLFFFARDQLMSGKQFNVPAVVKERKVNTVINFVGERSSVEIDAVDFPIDVLKFEGNAQFTGIFGLTGDFEGWFSNDDARVPIVAKMKVILGSITIELMQWKRPGWTPPPGQG